MKNKNEFYCHYQMGCHGERGITIAGVLEDRPSGKILKLGIAVKNPSDVNYEKKIGRQIAKWRALNFPYAHFPASEDNALEIFKKELKNFDKVILQKLNRPDALDRRNIYFWLNAKGMINGSPVCGESVSK